MKNIKITDLPLATGITSDDILLMVDDPLGTSTTKKISANYVAILDSSGRLNNAQLPDNIEARLSVLNDTDTVLSEVTLNTGELAAPTDKNYLRVGDGVNKGGKIIGAGNAYIEKDSTSLPIVTYTSIHPNNSGVFFGLFTIIPSQIYQVVINGSGEKFDYPGLWISEPQISNIGSNISSATYPNVVGISNITIASALTNCSSISFPSLKIITGNTASAFNATGLNSIYMPELEVITGSFNLSASSLSVLYTPKLKFVGALALNAGLSNLQNLEISSLRIVNSNFNPGGTGGNNMNSVTKIDAPSLEYVNGTFTPGNMTSLSGIYLPKIKIINGAVTVNSTTTGSNLNHFDLGSSLVQLNGNISLSGQKLTADSVNNILIRLAALDGTGETVIYPSGRTITLNGGTSAGLSSLSPVASGARSTLITRGVTVNLNA